jgi:hypothetical protein
LARRFVEKFDLVMPIRIRVLIDGYAEVEEMAFPSSVGCDAVVVLDRSPPILFLNALRPVVRQRFTLAHELGHLVLPWHAGPTVCEPLGRLSTPGNSGAEGEANVFASEVLVPRRELDAAQGPTAPTERLNLALAAEVSDPATVRAVADSLEPGYVLALCDPGRSVVSVSVSPGTHTPTPYPGEQLDARRYRRDADDYSIVRVNTRDVHWWYLAPPTRAAQSQESRSEELLAVILADMTAAVGSDEVARAQKSVAGIIGACFGRSSAAEADELVAEFRQRFVGRERLRSVVDHNLFASFLWSRAEELAERRRNQSDS